MCWEAQQKISHFYSKVSYTQLLAYLQIHNFICYQFLQELSHFIFFESAKFFVPRVFQDFTLILSSSFLGGFATFLLSFTIYCLPYIRKFQSENGLKQCFIMSSHTLYCWLLFSSGFNLLMWIAPVAMNSFLFQSVIHNFPFHNNPGATKFNKVLSPPEILVLKF